MGKKERKGGSKRSSEDELLVPNPEEGTVLCIVTRIVGAGWIDVFCTDGKQRRARIPGKLRRRMWMRERDIVLVSVWEFRDDRGDVIYRYTRDEKERLIKEGYIDPEFLEVEEF